MPQPELPIAERTRRKALIEQLLREGYAPLRTMGGRGSAVERACQIDGKVSGVYARWIRSEEKHKDEGRDHFVPNWSLYAPPVRSAEDQATEQAELTAQDHSDIRAQTMADEMRSLMTHTNYPVINPEAIIVDSALNQRYDRRTGTYVTTQGAPRVWLSETPKVAPIKDYRNRKFLFTAAQNDAVIHEEFWQNLKAYAAYLGAEIVVGPYTYETTWWKENSPSARWYDAALREHLCFGQLRIGDNFVFCGEMNTLPTASQPISDLVTYSRNKWAVFPHAKRQLKSVPSTDPHVQAHQVMTTGAVTRPKVIPRKAGVKSIFHQVIGATLVEFDDSGDLFCREITADDNDGSFYDLDRFVFDGAVTTGHRVTALVCGDIHLRKLDEANALATFGFSPTSDATYRDSIVDVLRPENILLHDVFDNEARNHHHSGDNAYSYEMAFRNRDSVLNEIQDVAEFLALLQSDDHHVTVVESNHDIGLEKYVREGRYRNDGLNIKLGLALEQAYLTHVEQRSVAIDCRLPVPTFSLLEFAVRALEDRLDGVDWVHDGQSRLIDNIEVGNHGFRGANGAKGTVRGFARTGRKMNIGDKHTPEIDEGVYVAGCMNLRHGYNKGPSGWAVTHIVQYPNGKRSLVTLQKGKWRAERPRIAVPVKRKEAA